MRGMFSRSLVVLAIGAVTALGADNSLGTWKLNIEKSKYSPAPIPVKSLTRVHEADQGGTKVTLTGERTDGTPIKANYTAKYDGSAIYVFGTGTPYDTLSIRQSNDNKFVYDALKSGEGKYFASGTTEISKDGKTMTTKAKGKDANGAKMSVKLVYDKQ